MPDSLPVELNRERPHQIHVAETFSTTNSFTIDLENRGEPLHVHLRLDDDLSRVANVEVNNHFVEGGSGRAVRVDVLSVDEPVTGKLKIATAYGSESKYVEVTVEPAVEEKEPVAVDENLARPKPPEEPSTLLERLEGLPGGLGPLLAVAVLAVILALAIAAVADGAVVWLGVGIVLGGVVAALVLVVR